MCLTTRIIDETGRCYLDEKFRLINFINRDEKTYGGVWERYCYKGNIRVYVKKIDCERDMADKREEKQMRNGGDKETIYRRVEKECCILCGRLTEVLKDCPISKREFYIEGAGQICRECHQEIYMPSHKENIVQIGNLSWAETQPKYGGNNEKHKV